MKRQTPSTTPQPRSVAMAVGFAIVANVAASASPYMGYSLALATMVLIGVQAFGVLAIWPNRKRREHPVAFAVFWGLILGLVVHGMIETIQEQGLAGWWTLLFSPDEGLHLGTPGQTIHRRPQRFSCRDFFSHC